MSNPTQPYPEASVTEISPGAAFAATGLPDIPVIAGVTSKGPYTPRLITDAATLVATYGTGDPVKKAAYLLARVQIGIVMLRMLDGTVPGVLGAVAVTRTSSGTTPTNTTSGTPTNGADVVIQYGAAGGVTGTGPIAFQVSTDGGDTFGTVQALGTATTITVLGVVLALGSGKTITTGDTTSWLQTVAAGSILPLTTAGTGTALASAALSGAPNDGYELAFKFPAGGTVGANPNTITYQYTLDYGAPEPTWTAVAAWGTGTTLQIADGPNSTEPTGLTLTLTGTDTIVAGDMIVGGTTPPSIDSGGVTSAVNALVNGGVAWTWVHFCGPVAEPLGASIASTVAGWATTQNPSWGVVDCRDRAGTETLAAWSARVDAEWLPFVSTYVGYGKGMARGLCPITGRNNRRAAFMFDLARACGAKGCDISTDWGEYDLGPLDDDVTITDINGNQVEYDSFKDQNGVMQGALALRTWPGDQGIFPATACLPGPSGDIQVLPIRRVFNVAKILERQIARSAVCKNWRRWQQGTTPAPYVVGNIYEPDARTMEHFGTAILQAAIQARGWCSSISFQVNRVPIALGGGNYKIQPAMQMAPLIYVKEADATAQIVNASTPTG